MTLQRSQPVSRHTLIETAIREYCRRVSPGAVQNSHGVDRIYYAGLSIADLVNEIDGVLGAPQCGVQNASALLEFFKWAMREGPWDGGDLDGGGIQDKAESLGLIVKTKYEIARHGPEHGDFCEGDDFYEFSPALSLPAKDDSDLQIAHKRIQELQGELDRSASTVDVLESNARVQAKLTADLGRQVERMGRCVTMAMGCLNPQSKEPDEALAWHRLLDAIEGREPRPSLALSSANRGGET